MRGPETRLRKKIVKKVLEVWPRAYLRKIHGNAFQNIGIPDLLGCVEGVMCGLEVKRKGKKPTPAQELELSKIKKAGGIAAVVHTPEEAIEVIREGLKKRR